MNELSMFIEILIKGAIGIAIPALVVMVVLYGNQLWAHLRAAIGEKRFAALQEAVRFGVQAAEQAGLAGLILKEGEAKKEYAIEAIQNFLKAKGFSVNVGAIAAAIEVAIAQGWQKANLPPPPESLISKVTEKLES